MRQTIGSTMVGPGLSVLSDDLPESCRASLSAQRSVNMPTAEMPLSTLLMSSVQHPVKRKCLSLKISS